MLIESIKIKNFKGVNSIEYTPKTKISVLKGANGRGKTSFLQGIEFCLTGKHSQKQNIRHGCDLASVELVINGTSYVRNISLENVVAPCMIDGNKIIEKDFNRLIAKELQVDADDLKVLSASKIFEEMSSKDMSAFLSDHIPEQISFETLTDILGDFNENALKILESDLGEEFTPNDFTGLYKGYYSIRRDVNRELKSAKALIEEKVEEPAFTKELVNAEKDALVKEEADYSNALKLLKAYELAEKGRKEALDYKETLEKRVKSSKVSKPDETTAKETKKEIEELNSLIKKENSSISAFKENNNLFEKTLISLDKPICPLSDKLVCSTDKSGLKTELESLIDANNKSIEECKDTISFYEGKIAELNESLERYNEAKLKYNEFCLLKKQLDEIKVPEVPDKPIVPDFDEELAIAKKKELMNKYNKILLFEKWLEDKAKYDELRIKADSYDALCQATNPKGTIIQQLLANYFDVFNTVCNEVSDKLETGFTLNFVSDDGVKLYCIKNDQKREYDNLSNGEKIIISFIVINMINHLTGGKILFLDNLNELDTANLVRFLTLLESSDYDHIFACSVDYEDVQGALDFVKYESIY